MFHHICWEKRNELSYGGSYTRMTKFKAMGVLLRSRAVGSGMWERRIGEVYAIVDKDPVAAVNAYGYYDEVQQVGRVKTLVRPSDIHRSGQGVDGIPVLTSALLCHGG